jgi:hypothetical protein
MYNVVPVVNIIAEYEALNVKDRIKKGSGWARLWWERHIHSLLAAGSLKPVHFTALYNLSYNSQIDQYSGQNLSPYGSPFVFRVTFL